MDLESALAANRSAAAELVAAAERCRPVWDAPRAPGKWSPSQIVEHVSRALEESAKMMSGVPTRFPKIPGFVRPVMRAVFFNRVLKSGAFPKARTNKPMNPERGSATPGEARARLEEVLANLERESRAAAQRGDTVDSDVFGRVGIADFVRFQSLHIRHHCKQMSPPEHAAV